MPRPMYCPNLECGNHFKLQGETEWYRKAGTYRTKAFGPVQRYRCLECGKNFSDQSFSIDYYAKKEIDYTALYWLVCSALSLRAISRAMKVSLGTVSNRLGRMRRNYWSGLPSVAEGPKDAA